MNHTLDLTPFGIFAEGRQIDTAAQLGNLTVGIADELVTANHIRATQAHLASVYEAFEARFRFFAKVVTVYDNLRGERHRPSPHFFSLWVILQ